MTATDTVTATETPHRIPAGAPARIVDVPDIDAVTNLPPPKFDELGVYFDDGRGYIVSTGAEGGFVHMNESQLRRHLTHLGWRSKARRDELLSDLDRAIHRVQLERTVDYEGPLAGHRPGLYNIFGRRVLVTRGPRFIAPDASVPFPTINEILRAMLSESPGQLEHFTGWLAHAYRAMRDFRSSHGQALALAGTSDAGKSLLQSIVVEVLGGRTANPYGWMTGRTDFNSEMFGCEVLSFGDEVSGRDYRARQGFGDMLKQLVVNSAQACHRKGREKLMLTPRWRLIFSLNDDPGALEVLPPLNDEGMRDKITLLRVTRPALFDRPEWSDMSRDEAWAKIASELPGFVSYLAGYEIPTGLRDTRLGVKAYRNPVLLAEINSESPAARLLSIVDMDRSIFAPPGFRKETPDTRGQPGREVTWSGSSTELENALLGAAVESVRLASRRLLQWSGAAGQFLTDLARKPGSRVRKISGPDGSKRYEIDPPAGPLAGA